MRNTKKALRLSVSTCILIGWGTIPSYADDFTVNGPTFETNGGPLANLDGDDTMTVTATGSITVVGDGQHAIETTGDNNVVTIEVGGALTTTGVTGFGVDMDGDNSTAINAGSIFTTGQTGIGIAVNGQNVLVANGGSIETTGDAAHGISALIGPGGGTIINGSTGTIDTFGDGAFGIVLSGENVTVDNAGDINTQAGLNADAITLQGDNGDIEHSGRIDASGLMADGIVLTGDNGEVRLTGSAIIVLNGDQSDGVRVAGLNSRALSAGSITIIGQESAGIRVNGSSGVAFNGGEISVVNADSDGIVLTGDDGQVANSGVINNAMAAPVDVDGIDVTGNSNTIENFGVIELGGNLNRGIYLSGNNGTILNIGVIDMNGATSQAIRVEGNGNSISHMGTIDSADFQSGGILVIGANNTVSVQNGGLVSTSGDSAVGINVIGIGNTVDFSDGTIVTTGSGSSGITASSGDNVTIRVGPDAAITTSGTEAHGIFVLGGTGSQVFNEGEITITNGVSGGIVSEASNIRIENTGTISIDSFGGAGIVAATGTNASILNAGLVEVSNNGTAIGIASSASEFINTGEIRSDSGGSLITVSGDDVSLRNAGRIINENVGNTTIGMTGANVYLRLDGGSIIVGGILFSDAATATLDIGLPNAALELAAGAIPATILSEGRPQFLIGDVLHIIDADYFRAIDQQGFAQLDQIDFVLGQRRDVAVTQDERSFWVSGNIGVAYETDTLYGMLGATFPLAADRYVGLFVGANTAEFGGAADSSAMESTMTYGGATWGGTADSWYFETALSFGTTNSDAARRIANNTVAEGFEDTEASFDSRFVGLSGLVGTETTWRDMTVRPSLQLRYGWQRTDAIEETGSTTNLAIEERVSRQLDLRAKLETDFAEIRTDLGLMKSGIYGGLDARYRMADDFSGTLVGNQIGFNPVDEDTAFGAFIGAQTAFAISDRASLAFLGEISTDSDLGAAQRLSALYQISF